MSELFREFLAVICFVVGTGFVIVGVATPFQGYYVLVGLALYVLCYWVWPSKRRGRRKGDNPFLDILELVVEFPVELILWVLRLFWRIIRAIFSGKGDGFDLDI